MEEACILSEDLTSMACIICNVMAGNLTVSRLIINESTDLNIEKKFVIIQRRNNRNFRLSIWIKPPQSNVFYHQEHTELVYEVEVGDTFIVMPFYSHTSNFDIIDRENITFTYSN